MGSARTGPLRALAATAATGALLTSVVAGVAGADAAAPPDCPADDLKIQVRQGYSPSPTRAVFTAEVNTKSGNICMVDLGVVTDLTFYTSDLEVLTVPVTRYPPQEDADPKSLTDDFRGPVVYFWSPTGTGGPTYPVGYVSFKLPVSGKQVAAPWPASDAPVRGPLGVNALMAGVS
ncbi:MULTISPECIES: hypothetical protein [Actinosynnema]|uniref:hypothetical protein n=1 Tax=Actinosynnema TaxID=40566 RepID=UPI0020A5995F|nr:hypothetical protein [Actinosynnema pretiosum]MCP2092222.1 hypothetical protein [Actinosynnema pretiosum]